jgi:hypothetical protein
VGAAAALIHRQMRCVSLHVIAPGQKSLDVQLLVQPSIPP